MDKLMFPKNPAHLRQGFGGSSGGPNRCVSARRHDFPH